MVSNIITKVNDDNNLKTEGVYCRGLYPREKASGLARPNARPHANPTERLTQTSWAARRTFPAHPDTVHDSAYLFNLKRRIPSSRPYHLTSSEAAGKLIHKLVRATQSTRISWQIKAMSTTYSWAYY
jgi:hypothetical protein